MPKLTGGEAIVKSLVAHGVDTLFGLPGVQNDYFYNALYDEGDKIRVIHPRHEQGAGYMALGYALSTGGVGVYNVVPGPGILNTMTALATAYSTNSKVLALTGQIPSEYIGQGLGFLHEIPQQLEIIGTQTKWAARISGPAEAPGLVHEAFKQMYTGRPQPVGLECALNVLSAKTEVDMTPYELDLRRPPVDTDAADAAAKLLGRAKKPVIFVGGGALDASAEVQQLAEALQAPVVSMQMGHGVLSSRHYLSHNRPEGFALWAEADVVLAVGTRLQTPMMSWGLDDDLKIIRIDIDPTAHNRIAKPAVSLVADSKDALQALIPAVEKYNGVRPSREEEMLALRAAAAKDLAYLEPQLSFGRAIREALPDDGIYVDELTQVSYVARFSMPIYQPRTFISSGYQGSLGYGFATALGVKVAHPDKPVLSVNGDGGFMFTVQELATAVQHKIDLVTVIFNDSAYGNVRRMQRQLYDNRLIATELQNPDFVKLAESFGAQGLRAETPDALRQAIEQSFTEPGPTIIDVPVEEMPNPSKFWRMANARKR